MIELYHADGSVCAQKARHALAEKGISDWVSHLMDLQTSEHFAPSYLALNPKAVVPTLVHDGKVVRESSIIAEYIDEAFDGPPLKPDDVHARAVMRRWAKIPDDEIHLACGQISQAGVLRRTRLADPQAYYDRLDQDPNRKRAVRYRRLFDEGYRAPEARAGLWTHVRLLDEMGAALAENDWLVGDRLTLADIGLAPYIQRLHVSGLAPMWDDKPGIARWFERIRARPSFEEAYVRFTPRYGNDPDGGALWPEVKAVLAEGNPDG